MVVVYSQFMTLTQRVDEAHRLNMNAMQIMAVEFILHALPDRCYFSLSDEGPASCPSREDFVSFGIDAEVVGFVWEQCSNYLARGSNTFPERRSFSVQIFDALTLPDEKASA